MKTITLSVLAAALATLAPQTAQAASVDGDPVLYWNQLLINSLPANPLLAGRQAAILNTAIHDAVNAAQGSHNHGYLGGPNATGGDTRAAASAAAHAVLKALYPANAATYDTALANSLALVPDGAAKTTGIASGAAYGAQILALRANDGWNAVVPYTPSGQIGRWAPTPPAMLAAAAPQWGDITPFLLTSGDQFLPGPPPTLDSAAYTAAFNEVKEIGAAGSALRTADQSAAATYWNGAGGPGPWLQIAIAAAEESGSSTLANATVFARLSTGIMDATIGIFDAKYDYDYWRPITAIRAGDLDGNADTIGDATWSSFITTPNHPSYISGHSGVAGAASTILADQFGDDHQFCLTWSSQNRCWDSYTATANDAAMSRLWGGIHWRFDNEAGLALGRSVGNYVLGARAFGAAPEPALWGMLLLGFGTIGSVLRRRPRRVALVRWSAD